MIDEMWLWAIFFAIVVVVMVVDLGLFNRGPKTISAKKSLLMTGLWIAIALAFGLFIWFEMGEKSAIEYYTGYVIEEAMSVDNLFVFILIFSFFMIPDEYQHKALFYGIIGALVFRAAFIFAGAALIQNFEFVLYIFAVILLIAALKTIFKKDENGENKLAVFLSKKLKASPQLDGDKFFTRINGKLVITPLLLCVIVIELSDIIFAIDSVPAILSITTDTFIVYTSNIMAIMGLRSLYFAIKSSVSSLRFMNIGLGLILVFIAVKILIAKFVEIPVPASLGVILGILALTVIFSLLFKKKDDAEKIG